MISRDLKIAIIGAGYVGMSLAALLAQHYQVRIHDIDTKKIKQINKKKSPIDDLPLETFMGSQELNIQAFSSLHEACENADFIIIAISTNYDEALESFDLSFLRELILELHAMPHKPTIVIKSTISIGFTKDICTELSTDKIIFSPEFLREGQSLEDNINPARIIIGSLTQEAKKLGALLKSITKNNPPVIFMQSTEAESIKLFANSYLAMRVSFFNELDSFALINGLDTKRMIDGVSLDPRIGNLYNNTSFGYGGYCLPKDSKQLLANFKNIPSNLISAIVTSNKTRKEFFAQHIIDQGFKNIGIYRLSMKIGSSNHRSAAIIDIITFLVDSGVRVLIYEPDIQDKEFQSCQIIQCLDQFKAATDVIMANRVTEDLDDVREKVFSRDIYNVN